MKKYLSLGELLSDYRNLNNISQADFAAELNVDVRTVIRWEKDITLIKSEKEEELVEKTFIPYQVIRNLNATVAIPTFYDFKLRKYSLSELSNELPDADWFIAQMDRVTKRIRPIEFEHDYENILRHTHFLYNTTKKVGRKLIQEASKLLPELNLIIFDDAGYYSGHCVFLPLSYNCFLKLRNREIVEGEITKNDLVDYKNVEKPVFHNYEIAADCNENMFYIMGAAMRFIREQSANDYTYSALVVRHDAEEINNKLGFHMVWEDKKEQEQLGLACPPRFYEGNLKKFF
ncbi:MAG TPA: helix-turn-helix transcriptional regulator [Bacteroidales bacterium]